MHEKKKKYLNVYDSSCVPLYGAHTWGQEIGFDKVCVCVGALGGGGVGCGAPCGWVTAQGKWIWEL